MAPFSRFSRNIFQKAPGFSISCALYCTSPQKRFASLFAVPSRVGPQKTGSTRRRLSVLISVFAIDAGNRQK
jgi:hypothetical protein